MELMTDTPWGRIQQSGMTSAQISDLLAICLSRDPKDAERMLPLARKLVRDFGPERLTNMCQADFEGNLESYETDRVLAGIELGRRSVNAGKGQVREIKGADLGAQEFATFFGKASEERFAIALLTTKSTIIGIREIHRGTRDSSLVDAKMVFGSALKEGAARIILGHNHPSGDPEPSPEDIDITRKLVEGGRLLDLEVLDHIIVGHAPDGTLRYTSLRRRGLM
jgi:DNA repair protein RadC